ncbi:MAG: hypothetical protein KCHDKBKB_01271 [Elusimicrobia bacterium]|nr:hypothetical protein [Elusimicrobiota bacterium]
MASEGMQLAVTLLIFIFVGLALDKRLGTSPWFMLGGAGVGIVVGLYSFLRKFISKP